MAQPEVLMCAPRPGQQQLQQKLAAVRASLGLLYSWCSLVAYNTLSRKQLAVGAVTSYPFALDPVAGEASMWGCFLPKCPCQHHVYNISCHLHH
jgi:hypothetical protein